MAGTMPAILLFPSVCAEPLVHAGSLATTLYALSLAHLPGR